MAEFLDTAGERHGGQRLRAVLTDLVVVALLFAAAGAAAGALWPQLVDPVPVRRTELGNVRDEAALAHRIANDGWYSLLGGVGGLVVGVAATAWRRAHEVVTVLAVGAGALLAAWLSATLGTALGPADPDAVLAGAEVGATAPDVVRVYAEAAYLIWPAAALGGALVVLWGPGRSDGAPRRRGGVDVSGPPPATLHHRPGGAGQDPPRG